MPKRITILDPNGVEVARGSEMDKLRQEWTWQDAVQVACDDLADLLKRDNPKLGTYTVTVTEVER